MLATAFDRWLGDTLEREGTFTMFVVLFAQAPGTIEPVRSSYLHVIGPEFGWHELAALAAQADDDWHALAVFAAKGGDAGGPLRDGEAQRRLAQLEQAVLRDRLTVRRGELFDRLGRRLDLRLAGN